MEIVNDPNCQPKKFRHSYLRSTVVLILVTLMVGDTQAATCYVTMTMSKNLIYNYGYLVTLNIFQDLSS